MIKEKKNPPNSGGLGKLICIDKQGLTQLLADFNSNVKSKDEVLPFIDRYLESMRRLNLGRR